MQKLLNWCNENILYILTLFLLAFIPLYPKLPLINIIRTWVYIRLEDFLIAVSALILGVIFIREKRISKSPLIIPIIIYWIIGAISLANALLFIFPHLTSLFPHLGILHFVRRIEYMIVCFLAFEAFRKKPALLPILYTLAGSFILVILYGFGQKFLGFPAFLTMNEEFAKGVPLRLPSTARFPSTFGGHYDLAAYLVLTIPIMGSMIIAFKKYWQKIVFLILTFLGLVMLLFTSSRISFGVYLIVMSVMLWWQHKKIWIIPMIIASFVAMSFVSGASERFYKTFRTSDVVIDLSTGRPIGTLDSLDGTQATLAQSQSPATENLPIGSEYINLGSVSTDQIKTVSLYQARNVSGASGEIATISGSFLIQKALVYDISITTRFQGQWPRAIEAFKRNILLGSGYSSLSVAADGDYHRMLGETGIIGAIAFLGIFAASFLIFVKRVGAYTLWILQGFVLAMLVSKRPFTLHYAHYLWKLLTHKWAYIIYLFLAIALIWGKVYSVYFLGDDFTWLKWAAQSSFSDIGTFFSNSQGFFYRPIPKLWYFVLFSVFWLKPFAYHLMSIALLLGTTWFMYIVFHQISVRKPIAWIGALLFASLSVHHENIYWISGQSSMLSGFFLLASVVTLGQPLSYVLIVLSMLSYDGMVIAPLVLFFLSLVYAKNKKLSVVYLLFIPLYWLLRNYAGALASSGDYGYKLSTFIVNIIGNISGYTIAIFAGPGMVEKWNALRVSVRPYIFQMTTAGIILSGIFFFLYRYIEKKYTIGKKHIVWFICYLVTMAAYAPLGGMAERYLYIPSIFFMIGLVLLVDRLWKILPMIGKCIVIVLTAGLLYVNIIDTQRVGNDWIKASSVVEQTLRIIKKEAFPATSIKQFFIVDIPIRYGRAWIFPTGMTDALWHIYRQNPYSITPVSSIEEGYSMQVQTGDREIFIFDNLVLKRGVKIDTPVEK
ncbi:MAG: hypothetical protein UT26_C0001G0035 [Microgenomates group bacterium GW2011_GWC1_39_12]|nr:MAG: hypothetical protein UT26_C0001G0035 [Microgenomates group bacterium GW2011_GWC1_39_12]